MEIKRIAAIAGVIALLMFGAFAAGGMNRSVSSAQSATGTAKVAQQADKSDNEANDSQKLASQAKISEQQAKDAALSANPGATVVKSELEDENGVIVYSIDLNNNREVKVDAKTGSVVSSQDGETNDDEDDGADGETNDD